LDPPEHPIASAITPQRITDDLERLLELLPEPVRRQLAQPQRRQQLQEVILDLGRVPEARYPDRAIALGERPVEREDLAATLARLGSFGGDNRAGIERTLHRISAIRNRSGAVVGLTCRVGRAVYGTVAMVRDLLDQGQSLLLMGRPGVGKTTALREIARVLADDLRRRVVIIDTSNEIAGDGDIPHPAIGRARRMQVARPELQHQVMIEAVENHMPEVIVIDEIGTELEAQAARTIAERGVMLVATAHGNALENLVRNPTLSDLVGGIQAVTLGDEEARRRRTQKTVLERAAEPTFPLAVEMHSRQRWLIHRDVAATVDQLLRGLAPRPQVREVGEDGRLLLRDPAPPAAPRGAGPLASLEPPRRFEPVNGERQHAATRPPRAPLTATAASLEDCGEEGGAALPEPSSSSGGDWPTSAAAGAPLRLWAVGPTPQLLETVIRSRRLPIELVADAEQADAVLSLRGALGRHADQRRRAQELGLPILVIKSDSLHQVRRSLERLLERRGPTGTGLEPNPTVTGGPIGLDDAHAGLEECRLAVERVVLPEGRPVELQPRSERVRQLQAELAGRYRLRCAVFGRGPLQRLRVFPA
jgi:stage III sporulation protein SpoIIIAA